MARTSIGRPPTTKEIHRLISAGWQLLTTDRIPRLWACPNCYLVVPEHRIYDHIDRDHPASDEGMTNGAKRLEAIERVQ
jgi:hypothetical protein